MMGKTFKSNKPSHSVKPKRGAGNKIKSNLKNLSMKSNREESQAEDLYLDYDDDEEGYRFEKFTKKR